ncbi:MAG: hypothetical protein IPH78_09660 [Bacteroidetes bacterium]|nr:hypothetical protein [Bacteroidota bacterium]
MNTYRQGHKLTEQEILVNEVILKQNNEVHLYGFLSQNECYTEAVFVISPLLFRQLLLQNGDLGREILQQLHEELSYPHRAPYELNVVEKFGTTLPLRAGAIQLQIPFGAHDTYATKVLFVQEILPSKR